MKKDPYTIFTPDKKITIDGVNKENYNVVSSAITDDYSLAEFYKNIKSNYYDNKMMEKCENGEFTIPINRLFTFPYEAKVANLLDGDIAEFGVANGATTMFLSLLCPEKTIYAFDTFEGFSPLGNDFFKTSDSGGWSDDIPKWRDWGSDFNWKRTIKRLKSIHNVIIKKGIFPNTTKGMEDKKFSLVHIDVDIYESTKFGLEYFWDKMVPGGMIVLDDFDCSGKSFPQVHHAVKDFFNEIKPGKPFHECVMQTTNMQGLLIKPFKGKVSNSKILKNEIQNDEKLLSDKHIRSIDLEFIENFRWGNEVFIKVETENES